MRRFLAIAVPCVALAVCAAPAGAAPYVADVTVVIDEVEAAPGVAAPVRVELSTANGGPATVGGSAGGGGSTWLDIELPPSASVLPEASGCASAPEVDLVCPVADGFAAGQVVVHRFAFTPAQAGPFEVVASFRAGVPPDTWTDPVPADNVARLAGNYTPAPPPALPPAPPQQEECTIAYLRERGSGARPSLQTAATTLAEAGLSAFEDGRIELRGVPSCGVGRMAARVELLRAGRKRLTLAKGSRPLTSGGYGRSAIHLHTTRSGRERVAGLRRARVRLFVTVSDSTGAELTMRTTLTLAR